MAVTYHFTTEWRFRAPVEQAWSVILDIQRYPGWWKNFRRVKVIRGDGKSEAERPRHIMLRSTGDLVGTGRWAFSQPVPEECLAIYYWDVATTNPILNLIAPLARGALAANHTRVMANGYAALRPHVEAVPR